MHCISFNCRTVGSTDKQSICTLSCILGLENMHVQLNGIHLHAANYQVARQDSRHGGPEESKNANTVLKLAQLRWTHRPCYKHAG